MKGAWDHKKIISLLRLKAAIAAANGKPQPITMLALKRIEHCGCRENS